MNILVTGSNGQLGNEIRNLANDYSDLEFTFTDIEELDITNKNDVKHFLEDANFDALINCAAYTNVDKCESNKKNANKLNGVAPRILAEECSNNNMGLIHISTDYVFNGTNHTPYKETDFTNPNSTYGKSKLMGELMVEEFATTAIIIRTSWLYSSYGHNFVKTIMKYGQERDELRVVFDQIGTPTYARDLARTILSGIKEIQFMEGVHIFHYSNEGVCSWYDFAKEIVDIQNIECKILPIETKDYPLPANRPAYSVLNKAKIKNEFDIEIPHWKVGLKECLARINKG